MVKSPENCHNCLDKSFLSDNKNCRNWIDWLISKLLPFISIKFAIIIAIIAIIMSSPLPSSCHHCHHHCHHCHHHCHHCHHHCHHYVIIIAIIMSSSLPSSCHHCHQHCHHCLHHCHHHCHQCHHHAIMLWCAHSSLSKRATDIACSATPVPANPIKDLSQDFSTISHPFFQSLLPFLGFYDFRKWGFQETNLKLTKPSANPT